MFLNYYRDKLGNQLFSSVLNIILIGCKSYIYACKMKQQQTLPNTEGVKRNLISLFKVNKYKAVQTMNLQDFENQ